MYIHMYKQYEIMTRSNIPVLHCSKLLEALHIDFVQLM